MGEPEEGMIGKGGTKESCATNKSVEGCIGELVMLAKSDFEKKAVVELASLESKIREELGKIKTELSILKYLIVMVLATVIISKVIGG